MLTIHVGLHKTGSSAIQHDLAHMSSEELRGVIYRGRRGADNDGFLSADFPGNFAVPTKADRTPSVRMSKNGHHVVLSHENFLGHPYHPETGDLYGLAVTRAAAMRDYFINKTDFQIVIYLRRQHEWIESLYNHRAKTWKASEVVGSTEFVERLLGSRYFEWKHLVNDLKETVGPDRLIVRPYGPDTDATADFLTILGLPTPKRLKQQRARNSSLTPQQIALLQRLTEELESAGKWGLASWFRSSALGSMRAHMTPSYSFFTEEIQGRLIELTASDWLALPAAVADSALPVPHLFESLAVDAEQAPIRPFLGPLSGIPFDDEAVGLLADVLPYMRTHPKTLSKRAMTHLTKFATTFRHDHRGAVRRIGSSFTRRMLRRSDRDMISM